MVYSKKGFPTGLLRNLFSKGGFSRQRLVPKRLLSTRVRLAGFPSKGLISKRKGVPKDRAEERESRVEEVWFPLVSLPKGFPPKDRLDTKGPTGSAYGP